MYPQLARAAALLLFSASLAQAADTPVDCAEVDKLGGRQAELNTCRAQQFAAADAELNKTYGRLRQHFKGNQDTEAETLLIKAQRAWVAWRIAEGELCAQSRGWSQGGSGYGEVVQSCETDLTSERTRVLRKHLQEAQSR